MTKRLYLLRHAKSDQNGNYASDHERPLNARGRDACKKIGAYFKENSINPEIILSSDSARTTETINSILRAQGREKEVDFRHNLYCATAGEILKEVATIADEIASIMVVAHNPGTEMLASNLAGSGNKEAFSRMTLKYPTAGLTILTFEIDNWQQIDPESGELVDFIVPKMLG